MTTTQLSKLTFVIALYTSPWRPLISLGKQTHGEDVISRKDLYVRIYLCNKRLSMKSSRYETIVDL